MPREWTEGDMPHLIVGGKHDGDIVSYFGHQRKDGAFGYGLPGILFFVEPFVEADSMKPLTPAEANEIERRRETENS